MMDAIDRLGDRARGVAVLASDTPGSMLDDLHRRRVRGLRINVASSRTRDVDEVGKQVAQAAALCARNGWHVQTFLPSAIEPLADTFVQLPVPVVIDHFGMIKPGEENGAAAGTLARLLHSGRVWVKLSASYRITEDACDPAIITLARRLAAENAERVVWGSDWPHTPAHASTPTASGEEQPYRDLDTCALITFTRQWFNEPGMLHRMLTENPAGLYDFHA